MQTFRKMYLEVYRRGTGEGMVALYASDPTVGDPEQPSREAGLRGLSFYFTIEEFEGLLSGKLSGCNDIGHNVRAFGELYTFFDLDFSSEPRGVLRVPYVNVTIPRYVGRILTRAVRLALVHCEPDGERLKLDLPYTLRERWTRHYGQGTGRVRVDVEASAIALFEDSKAKGGETFANCIRGLERIASNSTYRHTDVAAVKLYKDHDGFYFEILAPDCRRRMNGGVINHGRDGAHDWSTHT